MDTRFLESFIVVVDRGSIAQAAQVQNLTPAAVAQRIRALENDIGAALISRSGRTVQPTKAGWAILDRARDFVKQVSDLQALAAVDEPSGEIRIGANSTAIAGMLPGILQRLSGKHPNLGFQITRGHSGALYREVMEQQLDAAIIAEPSFAIPKACGWRDLRREPLVLLTSSDAPRQTAKTVLRNNPYIRFSQGRWGKQPADVYLRDAGLNPSIRFELDALDAIAVMVHEGLGVSLVPDWAPPWPEDLAIRKTQVGGLAYARKTGVIWLRSSARIRLIDAFLDEAGTF